MKNTLWTKEVIEIAKTLTGEEREQYLNRKKEELEAHLWLGEELGTDTETIKDNLEALNNFMEAPKVIKITPQPKKEGGNFVGCKPVEKLVAGDLVYINYTEVMEVVEKELSKTGKSYNVTLQRVSLKGTEVVTKRMRVGTMKGTLIK